MGKKLLVYETNIYEYPTQFFATENTEITIGDLHGNALKLFFHLLSHQIIRFKDGFDAKKEYNAFVKLYEAMDEITERYLNHQLINKNHLQELADAFHEILEKIEVSNNQLLIRFIGDMLADRGASDYFTLRLLELLRKHGVKIRILLSNHDNVFIEAIEKELTIPKTMAPHFLRSIYNLKLLLDMSLVSIPQIITLYQLNYLPNIRVFDCTQTATDELLVFSHAPIELQGIFHTAKLFGIPSQPETLAGIQNIIDLINQVFLEFARGYRAHSLFTPPLHTTEYSAMGEEDIARYPLTYVTWNRTPAKGTQYGGARICFGHGHHSCEEGKGVSNLDTSAGKYSGHQLELTIRWAQDKISAYQHAQERVEAAKQRVEEKEEAERLAQQAADTTQPTLKEDAHLAQQFPGLLGPARRQQLKKMFPDSFSESESESEVEAVTESVEKQLESAKLALEQAKQGLGEAQQFLRDYNTIKILESSSIPALKKVTQPPLNWQWVGYGIIGGLLIGASLAKTTSEQKINCLGFEIDTNWLSTLFELSALGTSLVCGLAAAGGSTPPSPTSLVQSPLVFFGSQEKKTAHREIESPQEHCPTA